MSRWWPYVLLALVILVVSVLSYSVLRAPTSPPKTTTDFPADFILEVADTEKARVQGLSGRAEVPDHYGMLFVFPTPGNYSFWMKDMLVPIDIIWISGDGTILGIEHTVAPETFPNTFAPPAPVVYVLETRAGYARSQGWEAGTVLPVP